MKHKQGQPIREFVALLLRKHVKATVIAVAALFIWATLVSVLWLCGPPPPHSRAWIELANGATWPTEWSDLHTARPFWFALVLGTRTALNFAGPLLVLGTGLWFIFVEVRRAMLMSRKEQLLLLCAELVPTVTTILSARHTQLNLTPEDLRAVQAEVDRVAERFAHDVDELEAQEGQVTK